MIRRRLLLAAIALTALVLPIFSQAQTTEVAGQKFDNEITLAGSKLQLNGAGIRHKLVFKVYAAGLYLGAKATTPEAALAMAGPKRIHVVMLRNIDANELGKLFTNAMEKNVSREEFVKTIPGTIKMGEIFASRNKLGPGEYFDVDYVPGTGTTISVNGKGTAEPIKEPEFFSALMKIWLGKAPADERLKEAMLGGAAKNP